MAKVVVTHDVADVEKWLAFKAERAEAIGSIGGSKVVDHVAAEGSPTVAVGFEIDDVEGMMAALASPTPELAEIMARHGVRPPLTTFVEG